MGSGAFSAVFDVDLLSAGTGRAVATGCWAVLSAGGGGSASIFVAADSSAMGAGFMLSVVAGFFVTVGGVSGLAVSCCSGASA